MKFVYCSRCDLVSSLASLEPERCQRCQGPAVPVPVGRPWQYWAAIAIIAAGAIALLIANLPDIRIRVLVLVPVLAVGLTLSTWGIRVQKERALERAHRGRKAA